MFDTTSITVSIITPAYNCVDTIATTLECILDQTYSNIEHIIVDDGSSDNTAALVDSYVTRDKRIKLIRSHHSGRSNARNKGAKAAQGKYLLFLDSDDTITLNYIETMLAYQSEERIIPVCKWSVKNPSMDSVFEYSPKIENPQFPITVFSCPLVIHSCLIKRDLFISLGGFNEQLDHAEDWALWQKIARLNYEFVLVPKVLAHYKIASRTLESNNAHKEYKSICRVIGNGYKRDDAVSDSDLPFYDGLQDDLKNKYIFLNWCWYVGIEASQNIEYKWLDSEAIPLQNSIEKYEWKDASEMIISALKHSGADINQMPDKSFPFLRKRLNHFFKSGEKYSSSTAIEREISSFTSSHGFNNHFSTIHVLNNNTIFKEVSAQPLIDTISFKFLNRSFFSRTNLVNQDVEVNAIKGFFKFSRNNFGSIKSVLNLPRLTANAIVRFHFIKRHVIRNWIGEILDLSISKSVYAQCTDRATTSRSLIKATVGLDIDANTFDKIFSEENPWKYDSYYETLKYEQTIKVSNLTPEMNVAEIGCAEGHFTTRICDTVSSVVACDISTIALDRLDKKLKASAVENVETKFLDIRKGSLQGNFDLIFCSEILYYMGPIAELKTVIGKLISQINTNGYFVHAHAFEASERNEMPGFGWRQEYGAAGIQKTLQSFPNLELEESITSDLYVIERYKKTEQLSKKVPLQNFTDIEWDKIEPDLSRQVLKNGYICTPSKASKLLSNSIAVLNYHSIGDDLIDNLLSEYQVSESTLAQHLEFLRSNGFRSATPNELINLTHFGKPPSGKVVALTFDDAYEDFLTVAKPVLDSYGFNAFVFVPTNYVGKHADWDRRYGVKRKMLDWEQITYLSASGYIIGSHFTEHTAITCLDTDSIIQGFLDSNYLLEKHTGQRTIAVAYPYGAYQDAITRVAKYTGYNLGFTTSENNIFPYNNPMQIGRHTLLRQHNSSHIDSLLPEYRHPSKSLQLYKNSKSLVRQTINKLS